MKTAEEDAILQDLFASGVEDVRAATAERLFVPQIRWDRLAAGAFDANGVLLASRNDFPAVAPEQVLAAVETSAGLHRRQ